MTPGNKTLVTNFGVFMMMCGVVSLLTGTTYYRGTIDRADDPVNYWVTVGSFFVLGLFCLMGVWFVES